MTKRPELQLKGILDRIKKTIGGVFGLESMRLLGEESIKIIRRRTRLGFGVARVEGSRFRLRPLSTRYVQKRSDSSEELSPYTKINRSNLTYSGEMLDEMDLKKLRQGSVIIGFSNNASLKKAEWNTDMGRPFNHMSKLEIKQLRRFKEKELGNALRKARL
jgi:hypothetical protein